MKYEIQQSITNFYQAVNIEKFLSLYKGEPVFYQKIFNQGIPYFIKIEKLKEAFELIDDEEILKICCINSPHVLKYYDVLIVKKLSSDEKIIISISEFVEDHNFFEYVTYLHTEKDLLFEFFLEITSIFDIIHSHGVLHRDISIYNFGLRNFNNKYLPVLLDFNMYKEASFEIVATPEFLDPLFDFTVPYQIKNERRGVAMFIYFLSTFNFPYLNRLDAKKLTAEFNFNALEFHLMEHRVETLITRLFYE